MCGIFGFSEVNANTRALAPILAFEMENRGDDSWGMTNGHTYMKFGHSIEKNFHIPEDWDGTPAIFHTRAASVGTVSKENAHPFLFTHTNEQGEVSDWIIGIHNGHISNHAELAKKYKREFAVDSMHIFRQILDELPTKEIFGWGAIAYFRRDEGIRTINLARFNMFDLTVMRLKTGEIVFCSLKKPITKGVGFVGLEVDCELNTIAETHYQIIAPHDDKPAEFKRMGQMEFGQRSQYVAAPTQPRTSTPSTSTGTGVEKSPSTGSAPNTDETHITYAKRQRERGTCLKCKETPIKRSECVMCIDCEATAYDEFIWDQAATWVYLVQGNECNVLQFSDKTLEFA